MLVLVVFMHIYMKYTKHGYEIAVIGDSVEHRALRGIERRPHHDAALYLSGAICTSVGFMVASGANVTLY